MECSVCMELFDSVVRRPKTLPCGHSFCQVCLQDINFGRSCPIDRKRFQCPTNRLPDNYSLLGMLADQKAGAAYYCVDCDRPASDACVVGRQHTVSTLRALRAERGEPQLRKLRRAAATARSALRLLERQAEELHARTESWRTALERLQDDEARLREALQQPGRAGLLASLAVVDALVAPSEGSGRLLAAAGSATLVLDAGGGALWRAAVELPGAPGDEQQDGADGDAIGTQPSAAKRARCNANVSPAVEGDADAAADLLRHVLLQLQLDGLLKEAGPECLVQPQWAVEHLPLLQELEARFSTADELRLLAAMPALRSLRLRGPLPEALPDVVVCVPQLESLHLNFMAERCDLRALRSPNLRSLTVSSWKQVLELSLPAEFSCRRLELRLAGRGRLFLSPLPSPLAACLEEVTVCADTTDLRDYDAAAGGWRRGGALLLDALAADLQRAGLRSLRRVHFSRDAWAYRYRGGAHNAEDCARQMASFKDTLDAADEPWSSAVVLSCSVCSLFEDLD